MTPEARRTPPLFIIVTVVTLGFALLSSAQGIAIGVLLGWSAPETALRLWASGIIWISVSATFMIFAALLAADGSTLLRRIRFAAGVIDALAMVVLIWLAAVGRMEPTILAVGTVMVLIGWVGGTWVRKLRVQPVSSE